MLHGLPLPFGKYSILSQSSPMHWRHLALSSHSGMLRHRRHLHSQAYR